MSSELIDLIINLANFDEKFDLMRNPKNFMDNEFSKVREPQDLELILTSDLSRRDIIKIYNLINYNFTSELTNLGFETLKSN